MEYCKNCGKPISIKLFTTYHLNSKGFAESTYCYPNYAPTSRLGLRATPKTKHDKIKEIIDDL